MHPPITKVVLSLFVFISFLQILQFTEGKTIVRVKRPKTSLGPKHIQSLVKLNKGVYALDYGYDKPIGGYLLKKRSGRALRRRDKPTKKIILDGGLKNYAKRYKTWTPSKDYLVTRNHIILDSGNKRPGKKRRRPNPPEIIEDELILPSNKRKRIRPNRINGLQRPIPPPEPEIVDDEYEEYFPEETKRLELDYDVDDRYRPKKRRNPGLRKKKPKKPEIPPKYYIDDDRKLKPDGRYKPEPPISYSNFIQHPTPSKPETEYEYPDEDEIRYIRNESKKKRKRVKKKSNGSRDRKRDPEVYVRDLEESYVPDSDKYASAYADEYELQKNLLKQKRLKARLESASQAPIYGDGHITTQQLTNQNFDVNSRIPTNYINQNYQPNQPNPSNTFNNNQYSRPVINNPIPQNFAHPVYEQNQYNQNLGNRFNQINPYNNIQPSNSNNFNPGFSNPIIPNNQYVKNQVSNFEPNFNPNYNSPNVYSNQIHSSGSYQQPVFARNPNTNTNSYQNDVSNTYKSSSVFDNTESFYDFNNNANVNSQQSKNYVTNNQYSSSNRQNTIVPSREYHEPEKIDPDNEFIAKHQNLYNNGISGIPIQGDGFGNSRVKSKDYDIGYGEFQFTENSNP